uniref:LAM_G_DOMAIN domain-containing protein n=1 Tax=Ascaris lumbricoides TaxID=6252 RepID=A0A0M3I194_ASCLU
MASLSMRLSLRLAELACIFIHADNNSDDVVQLYKRERTKDTIEFLGTNWQELLMTELGAKNVLPFWGGNMPCDRPTGGIRMAGPLADFIKNLLFKLQHKSVGNASPRSREGFCNIKLRVSGAPVVSGRFFEVMKLNAASQWQSRSTLSVLKIAARKSPVVSVHNFTDPTKLMWYFECEGGDIDFYIRIHNREGTLTLLLTQMKWSGTITHYKEYQMQLRVHRDLSRAHLALSFTESIIVIVTYCLH